MTCEQCLHKDVCRDTGTNYSEKGGAEQCYFFIEEKAFIERAINDLIRKLSNVIVKTKDSDIL